MRALLQSLKTGDIRIAEVPVPAVEKGHLLIRTRKSLISPGTERMLLEFGKASFIGKMRREPGKLRQVLDRLGTDGWYATYEAVRRKLDHPLAPGYCNAGVVEAVGEGVRGFAAGDRVVSNGNHAEVVSVPERLCCKIPDRVADEMAVFAVLGAISLEGVRLARPVPGETVAVLGLGLIGLLAAQILKSMGCQVVGIDPDPNRMELAARLGIGPATHDPRESADAVIIAASAKGSEPIHRAAVMCKRRGRIVLIGAVGLNLSRDDFYEKELTFQVSCSYGPDRYRPLNGDSSGQQTGPGWTVRDNLEAVLSRLWEGSLRTDFLISHRFAFDEAGRAYELLRKRGGSLGIILEYEGGSAVAAPVHSPARIASGNRRGVVVGVIGAGSYATETLIPALSKAGAILRSVVSLKGISAAVAARKFGFQIQGSDPDLILSDAAVNAVVIATRHDSHSRLVRQALEAGKNVFAEKPLALDAAQLDEVEAAYAKAAGGRSEGPILMVDFNRRFSPLTATAKELLSSVQGPRQFVMTVNAGELPLNHWLLDPHAGGGRMIGEGCHYIDLLRYLAGGPINRIERAGSAVILLFEDGSQAVLHYFTHGHRGYPKERLEVFCEGKILQINNFRSLKCLGWRQTKGLRLWRQNKGQEESVRAFVLAVERKGASPIPAPELFEVSRASIKAAT